MNHITYATEQRISRIKRIDYFDRTDEERLAVTIWDKLFSSCGYYGATLKEFEGYLGRKLDNAMQVNVAGYMGIHGLEYKTQGNVRYVGTHDLSHVNISDFNGWIKTL